MKRKHYICSILLLGVVVLGSMTGCSYYKTHAKSTDEYDSIKIGLYGSLEAASTSHDMWQSLPDDYNYNQEQKDDDASENYNTGNTADLHLSDEFDSTPIDYSQYSSILVYMDSDIYTQYFKVKQITTGVEAMNKMQEFKDTYGYQSTEIGSFTPMVIEYEQIIEDESSANALRETACYPSISFEDEEGNELQTSYGIYLTDEETAYNIRRGYIIVELPQSSKYSMYVGDAYTEFTLQ